MTRMLSERLGTALATPRSMLPWRMVQRLSDNKFAGDYSAERANEISINRCPKCNPVVRTPDGTAVFFWCGNDWHDPDIDGT